MRSILFFSMLLSTLLFFSCSGDDSNDNQATGNNTSKVADKITNDFYSGSYGGEPVWYYFNFETGESVAVVDSNSTKWDIAFQRTNIYVNGGSSGPGAGKAQMIDGLYDELVTVPTNGFETDSVGDAALPSWYNYSGAPDHIVSPKAGKVILVKTAIGKYVKLEILDYYNVAKESGYYKFRYAFQDNGCPTFAQSNEVCETDKAHVSGGDDDDDGTVNPKPDNFSSATGDVEDLYAGADTVYYNLTSKSTIADHSGDWDVAFYKSGIYAKSNGGINTVAADYAAYSDASALDLDADVSNSWYSYSGNPYHIVTPKTGTFVVVKDAEGEIYKLNIKTYYNDSDESGYYTFDYELLSGAQSSDATHSATDFYSGAHGGSSYYYYDLDNNTASTVDGAWDIAFKRTAIKAKEGQLVDASYTSYSTAPSAGYVSEDLPSWYDYNPSTHKVTPKSDKTVVIKTTEGKFVKLEVATFYKTTDATSGYYSFNYTISDDASFE